MPKRRTLRLFTKVTPPKDKENDTEDERRPLTATLEKPTILDISFIDKIDMTLMRKEFFSLCRLPLTISLKKIKANPKELIIKRPVRPLSLPASNKPWVAKRTKNYDTSEDSVEEESTRSVKNKIANPNAKIEPIAARKTTIRPCAVNKSSDSNNNIFKTYRLPRKLTPSVALKPAKPTKLPEPCKTCGRSDQPERLHSHPVTRLRNSRKMEESVKLPITKNTVQKPTAMRYKSKLQGSKEKRAPSPVKRSVTSPTKGRVEKAKEDGRTKEAERVKSAKRTLTCYLCGREFGTASLPLHEPRCLQVMLFVDSNNLKTQNAYHKRKKVPLFFGTYVCFKNGIILYLTPN